MKLSALLCALVLSLSSCASGPDWGTRVGGYTYDQAVIDYGPPLRSESLTDGTISAEFRTGTWVHPGGGRQDHTTLMRFDGRGVLMSARDRE